MKDDLRKKDWNGILRSDNVNINFETFVMSWILQWKNLHRLEKSAYPGKGNI